MIQGNGSTGKKMQDYKKHIRSNVSEPIIIRYPNHMSASLEENHLAERLLQSKHLVVVLGMVKGSFPLLWLPLTKVKGAGVSKAAGIQPFRGSEGLLSLSSKAENILDLFDKDTFEVWAVVATQFDILTQGLKNAAKCAAHASLMANLAKAAARASPTPFHQLLRALLHRNNLGRVYTQNIDDLELKTGLTAIGNDPKCVQLHGSVMKVQCTQCSFTEHIYHHFSSLSAGKLPGCPKCEAWIERRKSEGKRIATKGGLLRPAVILYRESHPTADYIAGLQTLDCSKTDNLLVVGTSLKTFGSIRLIKTISSALRGAGRGQVYYMDLESPPAGVCKAFDHILGMDCQDFANRTLDRLGMPQLMQEVDYVEAGTDLVDWVKEGGIREDMRPSWAWA
jgi:NAD-dependent histone deacetylase SIR2